MFGGTATDAVEFDTSKLYSSEDTVLAYCIDVMNNLLGVGTYNVEAIGQTQIEI